MFKDQINDSLLKYTAGHYIFCPVCDNLLDWKTVVILEVSKEGEYKGQQVCCTKCFKPSGISNLESKGIAIEVTQWQNPEPKK
jgi:hypothetical protein